MKNGFPFDKLEVHIKAIT